MDAKLKEEDEESTRRAAEQSLQHAVIKGDVENVSVLMGRIDVKRRNDVFVRGMIDSASYGHLSCLKLFLNAVPRCNHIFLFAAMLNACEANHVDCVKLLLENKAAVHAKTVTSGYTALAAASKRVRNAACMKLLVEEKACVNQFDDIGCMKLLIEEKANVNDVDLSGKTPLVHAAMNGNVEGLAFLLEHKATVQHTGDARDAFFACRESKHENQLAMEFVLLACGNVKRVKFDGQRLLALLSEMKTSISECHNHLEDVLSNAVIVDTRIARHLHGLYHEPLECIMEYCGLEFKVAEEKEEEVRFILCNYCSEVPNVRVVHCFGSNGCHRLKQSHA